MAKKTKFLLVYLLFLISFRLHAQENLAADKVFPAAQLKSDLRYLRSKLESNQPNLWLYTPREVMNHYFDSLENSITTPLTGRDFYNHITPLASLIKDGHNFILPDKAITDYYRQNVSFFPFEIFTVENRLYVVMNFSDEKSIIPGTEILSINGHSSGSIINFMMLRLVRDGFNEAYPRWILNNYFRSYFGFAFGFPDSFHVQLRSPDGLISYKTLPSITHSTLNTRKADRYPAMASRATNEKGISYSYDSASHTTYLKILNWHNDILKKQYHQRFAKEIKLFAKELERTNSSNLVIDIRDNQGGNGENGIQLLRYLLDHPFTYFSSIKKRKGFQHDTARLVNSMRKLTRTWHPAKFNYTGKVFVLINGGSFSNSGVFASLIQEHKRGLIIGTESGGNNVILCGGEKYYILPNSRIHVFKATHQMIIATGKTNRGRGVIPDFVVYPTLEDQLLHKDRVMEHVHRLINF